MNVICLEDEAFYALIDKVVERVKEKIEKSEDKWISTEDAIKKLNITSKTTLQKFRNEGKIRFTQPEKKIILYDTSSINEYLEKHSNFNGRPRKTIYEGLQCWLLIEQA